MTNAAIRLDDQLIELLADGHFHSGQKLAEQLGVSRTAINKHMSSLEALQLDVFRVHGKGYKLSEPLQLLDQTALQTLAADQQAPLLVKRVTTSTNDDLKQWLADSKEPLSAGSAVIAEMQTAGRGRRGKAWISPFGANIYLSVYCPLDEGLGSALGLSVAAGIGLAQSLQKAGIEGVSVKWPNDVYIKGAKVAGILVELEGQATSAGHALVGIGLNLRMPERLRRNIDQDYTDIQSHLAEPLVRQEWAALLLNSTRDVLNNFSQHGLSGMVETWRTLDHFYGKPVRLLLGQHEQTGVAQGIDEHGALLVKQDSGLKRYFGGEVSVRAGQ